MQPKMQARSLGLVIVAWLIGGYAAGAAGPPEQAPHTLPEYSRRYTENALASVLQPGKVFYVATDGSDRNRGTKASPLGSLEAARNAIRQLKATSGLPEGGVHVVLSAGQYPLNESFRLSVEDSGTMDCPIVYRGIGADNVILTGGVSLESSRFSVVQSRTLLSRLPEPARGKIMSIDLSKDELASYFPGEGRYGQISMDGHLLQLAQWPNRGYHHIGKILDAGPTTRWLKPGEAPAPYSKEDPSGGKFTFREKLSPAVQTEFGRTRDMRAEGYFHNDWYFQNEPVGRIDGAVIQLLQYTRYGIVEKIKSMPRRVRLVNVLAELDEMGQWYFDRHDQRLYVWPIDGFMPGKSRVTVLGGDPLLQLEDTAYVTVRDVTLENSGELAVAISGGERNLLAGCAVRNGVGRGISISGGRYNGITGCDFYGLHTAFSLSGGEIRTLTPCYHFATNNIIHDCRRRGYGLIGLSGVGLHFAHNLLYNLNGAISFKTVNLLLEYNEFYHIGYEMGDFNVAYCGAQWYTMNNVIRHNFVHHLLEPGGHPVMGFRNDDGGAGLKIYGNIFYRSGRGGGQFHGPLNDFQNNITLDTPVMWWTNKASTTPEAVRKKWDDLSRFGRDLPQGDKGDYLYILQRTIGEKAWLKSPWKEAFPKLKTVIDTNPWAQTFCNVNRNYIYNVREPFHIHGGSGTIEGMESKETGRFADLPVQCDHELPWPITLDAFVDVPSLDFRFRGGFQVEPGFRPIPFEKIGLVRDKFRPSPPNKNEYRRAVFERFKNDRVRHYDPAVVNARYPKPGYLP